MTGQITLSDNGESLSGVRLLVERDAFSGENGDQDNETFWIPIGFVDANDEGNYEFLVPAGRIRVSAFAGVFDATAARDNVRDGSYAQRLVDLFTETNDDRQINELTSILGQVANMTWLGESQITITSDEANRTVPLDRTLDIAVQSSGVSGTVTWSGDEAFNGDPISETTFILRNIWSMTDNYTVETTSGSFTSDDTRELQGTGEATFVENGTFKSEGESPSPVISSVPSRGTLETTARSLPTEPGLETACLKHPTSMLPTFRTVRWTTNRSPSCPPTKPSA